MGGRGDFDASCVTGVDLKCGPEMLKLLVGLNAPRSAHEYIPIENFVLNFRLHAASKHSGSSETIAKYNILCRGEGDG